MNKVTLFANGIADFELTHDVSQEGTEILIPVKRDHLSDAINMSVFGETEKDKIQIVQRPNFQPQNANATFEYDKNDVKSLLAASVGATVKLILESEEVTGVIVGLGHDDVDTGQYKVKDHFITLYSADGFRLVSLRDVKRYQFTDQRINDAILRKMMENQSTIIPESSSIRLKVKSESGTARAVISYTVPMAAWAMEYQIRSVKNVWLLTGTVIVHNNSDQPWNDFELRCVSGVPFTVEADTAEHRELVRNRVSVHSDKAAGGTEVFRSKAFAAGAAPELVGDANYSKLESFGKRSDPRAVLEVGDFTVLSPKERVNVPANSSSAIEVIAVAPGVGVRMGQCEQVLYYRHNDSADRPQQAIRFTNQFPFSLRRGPCNIYCDGLFQGTAMLPLTKPGQEQFLLHGLDTGVEVVRKTGKVKRAFTNLNITKGVIAATMSSTTSTKYTIRNLKQNSCSIILDHEHIIADSIIGPEEGEKVQNGMRFVKTVQANGVCEFTVTEIFHEVSQLQFTNLGWLRDNVINVEHKSLRSFKGLDKVIDLGSRIDVVRQEIEAAGKQLKALEHHQKDIRANIQASGDSEHTKAWRDQLKKNDDEIVAINKTTIPTLESKVATLEKEFLEACQKVSGVWEA